MRDRNRDRREDAQTEEQDVPMRRSEIAKMRRRKQKKTFFLRLLFLILLAFVLLMVYTFRFEIMSQGFGVLLSDKYDELTKQSVFPIKISEVTESMVSLGKRNVIVTDRFIREYSPLGEVKLSVYHMMRKPRAVSAGNYFMVFSRGGYDLKIYSGSTNMFETKFKNPIVATALSKNGYFAVITGKSGSYTLEVFNNQYQRIWHFTTATALMNTVSLSDDGKYIAVGSFFLSKDGTFNSRITSYEVKTGEKYFEKEIVSEMIAGHEWNNHTLMFPTEKAVYSLDDTKFKRGAYGDITVAYCLTDSGKQVVAAEDNVSGEVTLSIFSPDCELLASKTTDYRIESIIPCEGGFLLITDKYAVHMDEELNRTAAIDITNHQFVSVTKENIYYIANDVFKKAILR